MQLDAERNIKYHLTMEPEDALRMYEMMCAAYEQIRLLPPGADPTLSTWMNEFGIELCEEYNADQHGRHLIWPPR